MYKVFFNERIVLLTDDFIRNFQAKYGLFYKYKNVEELSDLLDFYWNLKCVDTLFVFHYDIEELRERFKSCFQQVYAAGGLVQNEAGEYLFIKRMGKWDLPKGKINHNETFEDAALREVTEECGIQELEIISPLMATYHVYNIDEAAVLKRTGWFEMQYRGKEEPVPQFDEDITETRWFRKEDLGIITSNTYPAITDILKYKNLL
ncbi:MAG: NUDIX domain-containing protein [Bacteroidales bacterium]|nr:NUDIX domain-containing protein [Bacteroidales bacterium]